MVNFHLLSLSFRFPNEICAACELRSRCCTGKGGRTIGISAYYELTEATRERQKTEIFKKDYYQHRSGVEGSLSAFVRGHGMRVARYIGQKKTQFAGCLYRLRRKSETHSLLAGRGTFTNPA